MEVSIQKWGNSLALRIPNNYAKVAHLKQGSHVDLIQEDDKIIIKPIEKKLNLKELLLQINDNNIHKEEFEGDPIGKENW